jgi:hypothetical protein
MAGFSHIYWLAPTALFGQRLCNSHINRLVGSTIPDEVFNHTRLSTGFIPVKSVNDRQTSRQTPLWLELR